MSSGFTGCLRSFKSNTQEATQQGVINPQLVSRKHFCTHRGNLSHLHGLLDGLLCFLVLMMDSMLEALHRDRSAKPLQLTSNQVLVLGSFILLTSSSFSSISCLKVSEVSTTSGLSDIVATFCGNEFRIRNASFVLREIVYKAINLAKIV